MTATAIYVALLAAASATCAPPPGGSSDLRRWGAETLDRTRADLWLPARSVYAEQADVGKPAPDFPAWNWGCGVQLSALAAAAQQDRRRYGPPLEAFLEGLKAYWAESAGISGFDVKPHPGVSDRYYDDNAWMGLALAESYDATKDRKLLQWAEETLRFVLSGEDARLGGGIYWREQDRASKNTCSNGPAVVLALTLYQRTRRAEYLADATRIYAWTNAHLQDRDGLYWDNVDLAGTVGERKWTYNTALMLRANVLLYRTTHERRYLDEALRVGRAALAHWVDPATGAIGDEGQFAHLLAEAFLAVHSVDPAGPWREAVRRALVFVHDHVRDSNGHYAKPWGRAVPGVLERYTLIDQASAARAFWAAARVR